MLKPAPRSVAKKNEFSIVEREKVTEKREEKQESRKAFFLRQQAAADKKRAEREQLTREYGKTQSENQFKAKKLEKGKMALDSAALIAKEKEKMEAREYETKIKAVEASLISQAPSRQMMAEQHETEAQKRGRERRENERKKWEKGL